MPRHIDPTGLVAGLNAVEALIRKDPRRIRSLVLQRDATNQRLHALQREAEAAGIRARQLPKLQIDALFKGQHQGALAFCEARPLDDWEILRDQLVAAKNRGEAPIIVIPAAIEDPRNLGACIRTAAGLGASAMLLPSKGSTGLTPTAAKAASGAEHILPLCRARDIEKDIQHLRMEGFAVYGLESRAISEVHSVNLKGPVVLIIGGEDRGIPPHIARGMSASLKLPMAPGLHSYNASVALALLLYETARQREFKMEKSLPDQD